MTMAVDPMSIVLAVLSSLYILIVGFTLLTRSVREPAVGLLLLYIAVSALWPLGHLASQMGWLPAPEVLTRVSLYGLALLALLFLHLTRSFLRIEGTKRTWWGLSMAWMAGLIVLNENLLTLPDRMWIGPGWIFERQVLPLGLLAIGWGVFMGGATILTVRTYGQTLRPLHRNRIKYWTLALGLNVATAALLLVGGELLGIALHFLSAVCASYAVLTYRLPDVRQMARQTTTYLAVTLLTVIIYTAGLLIMQTLCRSVPLYSPIAAGAITALFLAILLNPLLRPIRRSVNRLISGSSYDPSRTLREYSTSISNILDLERLAEMAVGLIGETLGVGRGALFVVHSEEDEESRHFRLRGTTGTEEEVPPVVLPEESPVAETLRNDHRPLTQYDIDLLPRFERTSTTERNWLDRLDMDVYVPIYAKGEWIGLLALGRKVSGDRYYDEDLDLLSTVADQTAVALENARLFDDLRIRNEEIEQLNEDLTEANRELARLDQAKSDFIDIASHELRTPLTQVHGYNDILSEMFEDDTLTQEIGAQMTKVVRKGVERLEEIVDLMFDVSQLDTETLILSATPTSVASVVCMAAESWSKALEERGQTLTMEGLEDLPPIVADGKRLKQVFTHLIQNAIKFTPDGGHIQITGRQPEGGGSPEERTIEVVVADNGIGIASQDLGRVFEKFYRVGDVMSHSTGKTKFKGAGPGLGLTIARGIVEAHGGRIWAESLGYDEQLRPGSQFHVVLPVQSRRLESNGLEAFIEAMKSDSYSLIGSQGRPSTRMKLPEQTVIE